MAVALSQEEVLDFLCQGGGKVPNAALLAHFKHFLRDPQAAADQLLKHRETFKRYVNSVAVVKQEGAVKYVVLRSRYRDLLGEELTPANPGDVPSNHEPPSANNRQAGEPGAASVLHGAQVGGGGWSAHTEGNGYAYHRGEPVTERYPHQAPVITSNGPAYTGKVNGTFCGRSYTEPVSQTLQQPSSQSSFSSLPSDHGFTAPGNNTRDIFPHDRQQELVSNRTFSQEPADPSMRISSHSNPSITSTKVSLSSNSSIPSNKTSLTSTSILNKRTSSPSNASIPSTNISLSSNTSIPLDKTSSTSQSIPNKNTFSPSNVSISSPNISSPSNASIPLDKTSSASPSIPNKKTSSPSNASIPSTNISSLSNASIPLDKTSSASPSIPIKKTSSPSNASIPSTNISSLSNASIPLDKTSSASPSIPNKKTSSPSNASIPSTNISSLSNASIPLDKTSSASPSIPIKKTSSPSNASIPSTNISSLSNASIPLDKTSSASPSIPNKKTSSPSNASIPSTNISSLSNASIPLDKTSSSSTSILFENTSYSSNFSIPFNKTSSPSSASIPFDRTQSTSYPSIPSTNIPSTQNVAIPLDKTSSSSNPSIHSTNISSFDNASIPSTRALSPSNYIPFTKTSSPSNDSITSKKTSSPTTTSIPFSKTSSPSNLSTKTSEPLSNTSSHSKDYYPADNLSAPFSKDSSFCSSAETTSLHHSPIPDPDEDWRPPHDDEHGTETNLAFVSVSYRGQQEQKLACADIQAPYFGLNNVEHFEQEDNFNYIKEQQRHGFYEELTAPPPSRYIECTHPSSSLLLPHESSITPVDEQLEDYQPASPCPSPPLPVYDLHDMWMCQMPVFKSIRCQLSLQDMEDFVDQDSCGSEGSDSGEGGDCDTEHKDDEEFSSDSNTEKYAQYIEQKCENTRRCPPNRKFLSIIEQYNKLQSEDLLEAKDTLAVCETESSVPADSRKSPYIAKSFLTDQAPILFELAKQPPKHRASSRFQELMSSSDDELIDRDFKKRRRPSRAKRPPDIVLVPPSPDVDLLLTAKPVSSNKFIVKLADQKDYQAQYVPKAHVDFMPRKSFNYKSSTVPLDPVEHEWIVKSASGSWLQVYGLFNQDPQLAIRKDFISGYTALHWFAKHGAIDMFHKFVAGAKKAGVELDFNIKSNGGYTPLHIAAIHGHHKVAAMLVEKLKVNVKLRDNSGKRAWQYLSCHTSGEVWQLLGAPKGKTIFASRTLNLNYHLNTQNKSSQINRKTSLAAFLKPQHQKWKANNHPVLREREIYSD